MRSASREFLVGFLLVLALAAVGCQPIQPVSGQAAASIEVPRAAESEAITETAPLNESVSVSESVAITGSRGVTTIVESTEVSETAALTDTVALTESMAMTDTAAVTETVVTSETSSSAPFEPALVDAGLGIYRAQYCGVCHTVDAAGTRGTFGPPHNGMGATAVTRLTEDTYHGAATTPAAYVRESIVDPQAFIVPGYATTSHRMPAYAHLDAASLDALVAFLLAQ